MPLDMTLRALQTLHTSPQFRLESPSPPLYRDALYLYLSLSLSTASKTELEQPKKYLILVKFTFKASAGPLVTRHPFFVSFPAAVHAFV